MSKAVLTIDDIASANTPVIVDYLQEKNICPVMYAVGRNVEKYYDEAVYALQRGMIIGNHSYSHPGFSTLSLSACLEEIERNEALLDRLYADAGVTRRFKPFRFPYGDKGGENAVALQAYFRKNGFDKLQDAQVTNPWYIECRMKEDADAYWTFDFGEWQIRPDSDFNAESVFKKIHEPHPVTGEMLWQEGACHIFLLHAHDETETLVPEYYRLFLEHVMECGVEFVKPEFEKLTAKKGDR
ncbi:MAG: polysaccharide deacetylase family protein [Lachnospiraceae bacterium]|nr:polysaccharide deacetylase family protein [Lachnospiraceae bacterium]